MVINIVSDNREKLLSLLKDNKLTQAQAAYLICEYTHRPCSVRAVRSWINDPDKPSTRHCPDWAVDALTQAIIKNKNIAP